jgi:heme peroxidase
VAEALDRRWGWDRFRLPLGLAVLLGLRNRLRELNLTDTERLPRTPQAAPVPPEGHLRWRTADGSFNDLGEPRAGMAGTRFGRNLPLDQIPAVDDDFLLEPNPRTVSRVLLTRDTFQPATSVNLLAAAWIQFMVKDWFSHGPGDAERAYRLRVEPGDPWPESDVVIPRMVPDPTRPDPAAAPRTYLNTVSHWWDLSSLYGNSPAEQHAVRSGERGKLRVSPSGGLLLPTEAGQDPTTVPGFWVGLAMVAELFVLEHNAICDALHAADPAATDEYLFQQSRLINAALVAKIHTVEWTPAMIAHPTTVHGMRGNWYGLAGRKLGEALRATVRRDLLTGIPGSHAKQFDVPYSLTEEFTAVYRMHPLIPDDYEIRSQRTGELLESCTFHDLAGPAARDVLGRVSREDLFHTFGTAHPGAVSLRNYPRFLQEFQRPDNKRYMDLAATDLLRMREAAIPRYNEFRRQLRLRPAADFDQLCADPRLAAELRDLYGDIERVDLMVGMFAERKPQGFAFSDTAFRIFVLMASRRLNSDRFFTDDFTAQTYTRLGLNWIADTTMADVLIRHVPELRTALAGRANAFQPWPAG